MVLFFNFNNHVAPETQDATLAQIKTACLEIEKVEHLAPLSQNSVSCRICWIHVRSGLAVQSIIKLLTDIPEIKSISTGQKTLHYNAG